MLSIQDKRAIALIKSSIGKLQLDLERKFNVLTEVGSGLYKYTPIIASLANAKGVVAFTRDSRFGKGEANIRNCSELCEALGLDNIRFYNNVLPTDEISRSHIITNSGFLRPLNESFLRNVDPKTTVIPLMFEAWELREQDIDINYCNTAGIKVAGTWENHPQLMVFDAVKMLAVKMALEAGYEVYQNKIIVWGDEHFGAQALEGFKLAGADSVSLLNDLDRLRDNLDETDFIFFCHYSDSMRYFGNDGLFKNLESLLAERSIGVVHLFGDVDYSYLAGKSIHVYPPFSGRPQQMTFTLGHIGLKPIINLQVAGFKVAMEMQNNTISDLSQPITFKDP